MFWRVVAYDERFMDERYRIDSLAIPVVHPFLPR